MAWTDEQKRLAASFIARHEGLALKPYRDTLGHLTIGRGRCLTTRGITIAEADYLFNNDLDGVLADLARLDWWARIDPVRQIALADMAFNMGAHGLQAFQRMIVALQNQMWGAAAGELIDSKWAEEVGYRAQEDRRIILTGQMPEK